MIIIPSEWNLSLGQFRKWVAETNAEVYAIIHSGGDSAEEYEFVNDEDFIAFKLTFKKNEPVQVMGYRGHSSIDVGVFYCPYIPLKCL